MVGQLATDCMFVTSRYFHFFRLRFEAVFQTMLGSPCAVLWSSISLCGHPEGLDLILFGTHHAHRITYERARHISSGVHDDVWSLRVGDGLHDKLHIWYDIHVGEMCFIPMKVQNEQFNGGRQLRCQHLSPVVSTLSTSIRRSSSFFTKHCRGD